MTESSTETPATPPPKRRRWWLIIPLGIIGALALFVAAYVAAAWTAMGASATGERLARMKASPQWTGEGFGNQLPRVDAPFGEILSEFLFAGSDVSAPEETPPVVKRTGADFATPPASGLRVTWLGHSTTLLEIDGRRVLIDPVWGPAAAPVSWLGPDRWYDPPLPLAELPQVDVVVISHDHYDHLDYPTVVKMRDVETRWLVPLGVGAHLEHWGIDPKRIVEMDWWEEHTVGELVVTCTPSRHFSGRSMAMTDQNATLWSGWAFRGPKHRVFYSGDTALHDDFQAIGERLGPFDLTMMESGAYDAMWADVHLGPEQAVIAHQLVRGEVLLPVHWGMFDLAQHGWTEPIERVVAAAKQENVPLMVLRPGASGEPSARTPIDRWWPDVPWQTVDEAAAWSTSVEALQKGFKSRMAAGQ